MIKEGSVTLQVLERYAISVLLAFCISFMAQADPGVDENEPDLAAISNILSSSPNNVEEFLGKVYERFPNYLSSYALMYFSRSIQDASFEYPRAIVFGKTGEMVITFNGSAEQKGFNRVELMSFDHEEARFSFFDLDFSDGALTSLPAANPMKCLTCHQSPKRLNQDPRPNWEPYNLWPGALGSNSGTFLSLARFEMNAYRLVDYKTISLQKKERKAAKYFMKTKHNSARYRFLGEFQSRSTVRFTQLLAQLNFLRVTRLMEESLQGWPSSYRDLVARYVRCEKQVEDFFPPDLFTEHLQRFTKIKKPLTPQISQFLKDGIDLVFSPLGIDTTDWSMDFRTGGKTGLRHRFTTPNLAKYDLIDAMRHRFPRKSLSSDCRSSAQDQRIRKSFSEKDIDQILKKMKLESNGKVTSLIKVCAACHDHENSSFPYIPFSNEAKLASALQKRGFPRGTLFDEIAYRLHESTLQDQQMPPSGADLRSKEALLNYLHTLRVSDEPR